MSAVACRTTIDVNWSLAYNLGCVRQQLSAARVSGGMLPFWHELCISLYLAVAIAVLRIDGAEHAVFAGLRLISSAVCRAQGAEPAWTRYPGPSAPHF